MALDFGVGNTARYYTIDGFGLPDGPWAVPVKLRVAAGVIANPFEFLLGMRGNGDPNSFRLWHNGPGSGLPGSVRTEVRGPGGSDSGAGGEINSAATVDDGADWTIVVQRLDPNLELWLCPAGGTAVVKTMPHDAMGAVGSGTLHFGIGADLAAAGAFEAVAGELSRFGRSLSQAEIQAIAAGTPIVQIGGATNHWPFAAPDTTVPDAIGTADAVQHGTGWPPAAPDFATGSSGGTGGGAVRLIGGGLLS